MLRRILVGLSVLAVLVSSPLGAEEKPKPTRQVTYKTVGDVKLALHLFEPKGHSAEKKSPAIVFFFGGGWTSGTPTQFYPHCAYFAGRGVLAAAADYRVKSRHGVTPDVCVKDAKSAVRWLRRHADELGIDPGKIAAGGGSAGGHIAACAGTVKGYEEEGEDLEISSRPDALVLFNPALDLSPPSRHRGVSASMRPHSPRNCTSTKTRPPPSSSTARKIRPSPLPRPPPSALR